MSLCVSVYAGGQIYVFADGRVSANSNGVDYLVTDTYPTARCVGDKVIFTTGMVAIAEQFFQHVKPTSTLQDIQRIARQAFNRFKSDNESKTEYKALEHGIEFGVAVHDITAGKARYTQLSYHNDFETNTQIPTETDVFAWGANSALILPELEQLLGIGGDVAELVKEAYSRVSDIKVGGKLHAFYFDGRNIIVPKSPLWIRSSTQYPAWTSAKVPSTADMAGNVVARSIKLTGEVSNSEVISTVIRASKIIGNEIEGGTITGASIIGGSITSNTDINVTRDARIGNKLFMGLAGAVNDRRIEFVDPSIYEAFIEFLGSSSKGLRMRGANDVQIDAGLNAVVKGAFDVILEPGFGAYVGSNAPGNRIVTASELDALWSALNGKANFNHSHTLTLQNHNHGSATLVPSGGGTFTVS